MSDFVQIKNQDGIALLTLNNPPVNALNSKVLDALANAFDEVENDKSVRSIVITGAGANAFCAGADVNEMKDMKPENAAEMVGRGHEVFGKVANCPKPVIAAVNNLCLGGGLELALSCDIRYSSDRARFGAPEVNLGLIPAWGGTQRLSRLVGPAQAKELIFTGQLINAQQAARIGLLNRVVPDGDEVRAAMDIAKRIAVKSAPLAVAEAKKAINEGLDVPLEDGLAIELAGAAEVANSKDLVEGITAFTEKRQPEFKGE